MVDADRSRLLGLRRKLLGVHIATGTTEIIPLQIAIRQRTRKRWSGWIESCNPLWLTGLGSNAWLWSVPDDPSKKIVVELPVANSRRQSY